jgi:hypothetical protein
MKQRAHLRTVGLIVAALGLLLAGFCVGRQTIPNRAVPAGRGDSYTEGLTTGRAAGLAEGRALQFGAALPAADRPNAQAQFRAGYRAGAEDVFAGYDGGWAIGRAYVIVLSPGVDGLTYRISQREEYVRAANQKP